MPPTGEVDELEETLVRLRRTLIARVTGDAMSDEIRSNLTAADPTHVYAAARRQFAKVSRYRESGLRNDRGPLRAMVGVVDARQASRERETPSSIAFWLLILALFILGILVVLFL